MKKSLVMILLLIICISALTAQTGMLGLSFGLSADECRTILESHGLHQIAQDESKVSYAPLGKELFNEVWLYFHDDGTDLNQWTINYPNTADSLDIEHEVINQVIALHGDKYKWDDFMEVYYWKLGQEAYVECGWNCGDDYYFISYYK